MRRLKSCYHLWEVVSPLEKKGLRAFGADEVFIVSVFVVFEEAVFFAFDEVDGSVASPAFPFLVAQENVSSNPEL